MDASTPFSFAWVFFDLALLGFLFWQLYSLKRERRRDAQRRAALQRQAEGQPDADSAAVPRHPEG